MAGDRHQPAHPLRDLVDPGAPGIGTVLAKTGDAAVDDARVDFFDRLVIDAEPVLHIRLVVLDDDVGAPRELKEDVETFLGLQVQGHRPLVAVQVLKVGTVAPAAGSVDLLTRRLDLDDLRAPIGELAHRCRAGAMRRQVDHKKIVER